MSLSKSLRYSLDQIIRRATKCILDLVTPRSKENHFDPYKERIERILLVRANFRMGDLILATPAISLFRRTFPNARIDFVGAPMSQQLFQNLPIDHHYSISRRYPLSAWDYPVLMRQLRSVGYDLAVELSCSQSAMGSFVVGLSGARFRAGLQGKWDRWYNVRISRPNERSKYRILPIYLQALGLKVSEEFPSINLSAAEKELGKRKIKDSINWDQAPVVGVFVGGRKTRGKRWPIENFCQFITALHWRGVNVITFFGPEEKVLVGFISDTLDLGIPLVFEPSAKSFAAMVSNCDLFVTCDSGPMHLASALGTRTVAIFQKPDFNHWGPPSPLARIAYEPGGCSVDELLRVCFLELSRSRAVPSGSGLEDHLKSSPMVSLSRVKNALRRLDMSVRLDKLLFFGRCSNVLFLLAILIFAWVYPPSGIFEEGTWTEAFTDTFGIGSLVAGSFLWIWALSFGGRCTRSRGFNAPKLITRGPYAYMRHPIWLSNLILGIGIMFLAEAFSLFPLFLGLFALQYTITIAEETFLKERLGEGFELYCSLVPRFIPKILPAVSNFSFGISVPLRELRPVCQIILAGCFLEWIESPLHRQLIVDLFRLLTP